MPAVVCILTVYTGESIVSKSFPIRGERGYFNARAALALWVGMSLPGAPALAGLSFDDTLAAAEARAPELIARRQAIDGAEHLRTAAASLPDPKLVLGLDNVPINGSDAWTLDRDFMTMTRVGVMQELPNSTKRRARADAATASAERERATLTVERLMIRREAALAWLNRYYLERRLALLDELERENELLIKTTQAQLAGGQGAPADTTMARQEAVLLAERRDELTRQLARARATLTRFVGAADAADTLAGDPPALAINSENLRTHLHRHPELAVFEPMAAQAAAETRVTEAERRPDWGVELAYQKRGATFSDMASLQFTVDLPFFTGARQAPRIAAKRLDEARVAAEREAMLRKHTEELEGWLSDYTALSRKLTRTRDTAVALAREKTELLLASYRAGKGALTPMLSARRELIETRLKAVDLDAELHAVAARLAYLYTEDSP